MGVCELAHTKGVTLPPGVAWAKQFERCGRLATEEAYGSYRIAALVAKFIQNWGGKITPK